jgi:hypothetical protein
MLSGDEEGVSRVVDIGSIRTVRIGSGMAGT